MFNKFQTLISSFLNENTSVAAGTVGQAMGAQVGIFNDESSYPTKVAMATALPNKKKKKKKSPLIIRRNLQRKSL